MTVGEGELRRPKNSEAGGGARKGDVEFGVRRGIGAEPRKGGGERGEVMGAGRGETNK